MLHKDIFWLIFVGVFIGDLLGLSLPLDYLLKTWLVLIGTMVKLVIGDIGDDGRVDENEGE